MTLPPVILIADDHPLFREALQRVAAEVLPGGSVQEVAALQPALELAQAGGEIELIFLDLNMPGMNGFSGLVALRNALPATPIIVVSATEDAETIREAITCGASGFMPKSLSKSEMIDAARRVLDGEIYLPPMGEGLEIGSGDTKLAERRQRERELAAKSAILGATFDNISQGIAVVDDQGRLLAWNVRFLSLLNIAADELSEGKPLRDLGHLPAVGLCWFMAASKAGSASNRWATMGVSWKSG